AGGDRAPAQCCSDPFVIIHHLERTEVEFANMSRLERILAAALAALERFHKTMILIHNVLPQLERGRKNPFSEAEKRIRADALFSSSSSQLLRLSWNWHLDIGACRLNRLPWFHWASPSTTRNENRCYQRIRIC